MGESSGVPITRAVVSVEPITVEHLERVAAGEAVRLDLRIGEAVIGSMPLQRRHVAAALSPSHPSLSWHVNGTLLGHRRHDDGETKCGRRGELTVVLDDDVPPCPKCYHVT